jgi:uncharacterized protein YecA (UPF0149 family)
MSWTRLLRPAGDVRGGLHEDSERFERKAFGPALSDFLRLAPEEMKGIGRDDPCPCESGLKYKHCHGR